MKTYSEWSILLDRFANGMDDVLDNLEQSSFKLDAGTTGRFLTMINRTYQIRKQQWIDNIQRTIDIRNMKSLNELDVLIRQWKVNLLPLQRFSRLPVIPDEIKEQFCDDLKKTVDELKITLERSASENLNNKEAALFYIKNLKLYDFSTNDKQKPLNKRPEKPGGRKIIF